MNQFSIRILVVEDELFSRVVIKDALERLGYTVVLAVNGREALELCQREHFPIIITDRVMPEMDGIEFCRAMRAIPTEHYVYILLLTSLDKKDELIAGLDAGADEYLVKPLHEVELAARLKAARRILDLETKLKQLALHDQLTGAYNRGYLDRQLSKEVQRSWRYKHPLSIVICDIDHFKAVNDRYGHQVGDQVLMEFVSRMNRSIRNENDWVARYGGEEFVIVLPETPPAGCLIVAERIRRLIADSPVMFPGGAVAVTVSFGAVTIEDTGQIEEMTMDAILGKADECLYRAKDSGRNCVVAVQL
ncbi:MAG TPA: diguanylate cyclase [Dongiaceae bacterium]|nr:diguanylate cyclase [Dongiaceae bacterium]